jgi:hypothetical protein
MFSQTKGKRAPRAYTREKRGRGELVTKEIFPSIHLLHLHRSLLSLSLSLAMRRGRWWRPSGALCVVFLHVLSFMLSCSSLEIPLQQLMMSSTSRKRTGKKRRRKTTGGPLLSFSCARLSVVLTQKPHCIQSISAVHSFANPIPPALHSHFPQ